MPRSRSSEPPRGQVQVPSQLSEGHTARMSESTKRHYTSPTVSDLGSVESLTLASNVLGQPNDGFYVLNNQTFPINGALPAGALVLGSSLPR